MLLLKVLRFFIGYVYFTAEGGFAERFLNLCYENNIHIKDAEYYESNIRGSVAAGKYKSLHKIARLSGVKLKAYRKYGLVFLLRRHKKRVGLLTGLVFAVVFLVYTSSSIWTVDVAGGQKISKAEVISACDNLGLREGVLKKDIDTNELSRLLIMELSGRVSWISVNIKGTKAIVELRDYEEWKKDTTYGKPSNIVADFDGLLMTVEVYNGVKIAKEGNGVKKGDLLISGIAENRDTSSQLMEARGRVTALHSTSTVTTEKKGIKQKRYTYSEEIKILYLFGLKIPLGRFSEKEGMYDEFENRKSLAYGETELPLAVSSVCRAYYETVALAEGNLYRAIDLHTIEKYEKFKNTLLLKSESKLEKKDGDIKIETVNECIDFMGIKEEIYIE